MKHPYNSNSKLPIMLTSIQMRYTFTQYCPRFGFKQKIVWLSNHLGFNTSLYNGIYTLKLHRCRAINPFTFASFFL